MGSESATANGIPIVMTYIFLCTHVTTEACPLRISTCILKGLSPCSSKRSLYALCLLEAARQSCLHWLCLVVTVGGYWHGGQCTHIPPIIKWAGRAAMATVEKSRKRAFCYASVKRIWLFHVQLVTYYAFLAAMTDL